MNPDVSLVSITKKFGDVCAVDEVSLDVEPESFLTLLGPSGCGKTTILKIIAGFESPDHGDVLIRGERVNARPPYRRDTAMVFQSYALFPHMTVAQNVGFGLRYRGVDRREQPSRIEAALTQVGLDGFGARYPSQLSGGQQQRVALARAIVTRPALLLLDEPLSNLDLRLRQQMRGELRAIQREVRITTIYVTHDQTEAFSMSTKIAVMNRGRVVQVGTPQDIYLRPASEFVVGFIGESNRFQCTAVGDEGQVLVVRTDEDLTFRVERPVEGRRLSEGGDRFVLFFREEQAQILNDPTSANSFPGHVESVQNLGSMQTYTIALANGARIRSTVATMRANRVGLGDAVVVAVDPADCILIPGAQP
jgi:ABC-type Fe3+/spermidine/putrescine transport system ATPase subunit